jgi:hypothetical protein
VLTHTTTNLCGHREQQRYNIQASGELGEYYATSWQPGQAIVINGRLKHHLCDASQAPSPTSRSSPTASTTPSEHTPTSSTVESQEMFDGSVSGDG